MKGSLAAAVIIRDGRILLVHNAKHGKARFEPPGGKLFIGETPEEAVEREVHEELGVMVRIREPFGLFRTDGPEGAFLVHMYLCEITSGEPRVMEPEKIPGFGWYSYEGLLELKASGTLAPNLARALKKIKGRLERNAD